MPRCENCGKRTDDTLCPSCLHGRKKQEAKAAAEGRDLDAPLPPAERPDVEALKDRLRQIQEGLSG